MYSNTEIVSLYALGGRGSVVGITTRYGLEGPGIVSRWGTSFSAPVQTGPGVHPASYTMGTESLSPGVKWPGSGFDHPPPSSALWAFVAGSRANFTFTFTYVLYKCFMYIYNTFNSTLKRILNVFTYHQSAICVPPRVLVLPFEKPWSRL